MTKEDLQFLQKLVRLLDRHAADCDEEFHVEINIPNRIIAVNDSSWTFSEFMNLHWRDV